MQTIVRDLEKLEKEINVAEKECASIEGQIK